MLVLLRDGPTLEALFVLLRQTALQPLLTGPLLLLLHYYMRTQVVAVGKTRNLVKILKVLFPVGVLRMANDVLSKKVTNNWVTDGWTNGEEIVLITGGSSGTGEIMVKNLAKRSKVVAILDVAPTKNPLRKTAFKHFVQNTKFNST